MNTKEVCKHLMVTPKMLRVYEDCGLIQIRREENNYRDYKQEDIQRIQMIVMLRNLGFSLKEIEKIFENGRTENQLLYSFYFQLNAMELQRQKLERNKKRIASTINKMLNNVDGGENASMEGFQYLQNEEKTTIYQEIMEKWDFDEMADNYVTRFLKEDEDYFYAIQQTEDILKEIDHNLKVMDVGGGTCNLWRNLSGFKNLTIMDKSLPMLLSAKKQSPKLRYVIGDILDSMDGQESYDFVVTTFTLHHIPYESQGLALEHLLDLTKKDGTLYIVDRSFETTEEKEKYKLLFEEKKNTKGLNEILNECFLISSQLEEKIKGWGCTVEINKISDRVRSFKVQKRET